MSAQDRFYEIDFTNDNNVETLLYQIVDNPIADAWFNIVQAALLKSDCQISNNQWIHNTSGSDINLLWGRMKTLVDDLNTGCYGQLPQLSMPAKFDANVDHSELLNYLHLQFHKFTNQENKYSKEYTPLVELNIIIHKIEAVLQAGPMSCGFYLEWDHFLAAPRVINIKDTSWYQHWTVEEQFGDMKLGYHTVGKNLEMCYKDNDVNLVQSKMVCPQKTISSEVVLLFDNRIRNKTRNTELLKIGAWLDNNNLAQYVDITEPCNSAIGRPLLGKLVGVYTPTDISRILSLGRVSAVRLL